MIIIMSRVTLPIGCLIKMIHEKLVPIGESFVGVKLESFISKSVASYHLHEDVCH